MSQTYKRLPKHIGIIPDGNRRWALQNNLQKQEGYQHGLNPGLELYKRCVELGVEEITFYGFTQDNTKRPAVQTRAFQKACVDSVMMLAKQDASLLIVGNTQSPLFPNELLPYTKRTVMGKGLIKVNFLVNYGWAWDLNHCFEHKSIGKDHFTNAIASADISRMDLIIRWGGRRRLSGFLPIQSIYSDFYVIDDMWPNFKLKHLEEALDWYQYQDITLGG